MENLPKVQLGLKMTAKRAAKGLKFGLYQEARMRLIHRHIDAAIIEGLTADGRSLDVVEPYLVPEG